MARIVLVFGVLLGSGAGFGCVDEADSEKSFLFPDDLRHSDFVEVRSCRAPGEHSGLGAFTVWVNPEARDSFNALWFDPPAATAMEAGAVVVKEVYTGNDCSIEDVDHWVAMKKIPGYDPEHGDWRWQEADRSGTITVDGKASACFDCHEGTASCTGYGALNGRDYLCTVP